MTVSNSKDRKLPVYVQRAQRAFRRAAIKVRAEYKRAGLKPAVWPAK